jgi:hypothetical protein
MNISSNLAALAKTKWYEYLVRFAFGGAIPVTAGILAKYFGPVFGGLFLAFPGHFSGECHAGRKTRNREAKESGHRNEFARPSSRRLGCSRRSLGKCRSRRFRVNRLAAPSLYNSALVFLAATAVWLALAILSWRLWKKHLCR